MDRKEQAEKRERKREGEAGRLRVAEYQKRRNN